MRLARRTFLQLAAGAFALPALPPVPALIGAEAYPSRPLRLVVGFAAGGTLDALARIVGQSLSDRLGQPLIVENRAGANGNLATESVVRAAPDGYTILLIGTSNSINTSLYTDLSFNFDRDITPVASISRNPLVLIANPSLPVQSVAELIAYAKTNAGTINMASAGIGSPQHVAGELFNMMAGVHLLHVPYRGEAAAIPDLLGDRVQVMFSTMVASLELIRAGKLRPLAVSTVARQNVLPDVPPMNEFLPGYEASGWGGVGAPKNTPNEIVERLNKDINGSLDDPSVKARLSELGLGVFKSSPDDFQKFINEDTEKWAKVVRFAGLKAD
jgi:tripartite-type tricarboxylate transporter receptor subunit TctC